MAHPKAFEIAAESIIGELATSKFHRSYLSHFGVDPKVTAKIWDMIKPDLPPRTKCHHLLWALMLLKVYNTENILSSWVGVSDNTFRKHAWSIIKIISKQKKKVVS